VQNDHYAYLVGALIFDAKELPFAGTGGAIWSVAYEYVQGYRLWPTNA